MTETVYVAGDRRAEHRMAALREARDFIRERSTVTPRVAIALCDPRLGSEIGGVVEAIDVAAAVSYGEIPHFPRSTLDMEPGRLLLGHLERVPVVGMQGCFHDHEGYSLQEATLPVRVMRMLGAEVLIVTGACLALDPRLTPGDLVLIEDQINLMGDNPLVGPNLDELGPRFPDMSRAYDRALQGSALRAAGERGVRLHGGVYAAVAGPKLETRGESQMLRTIGADVVGMSMVPEVIVARHMGMRVLGIGIVTDDRSTDRAVRGADRTHSEAESRVSAVVVAVVNELHAAA